MLDSQLGVRLLLLIGDTVPLPAPYPVTTALVRAQVTNDARTGDGFQLPFALGRDSVTDYGLIASGVLAPWKRVVLSVVFGALPEVLIDGVITHQQVTPSDQPGASTLTVQGRDISKMLDLEEKNDEFPNQADFMIVTRVLAGYAQYRLVPEVTPTAYFTPRWAAYSFSNCDTLDGRADPRKGFLDSTTSRSSFFSSSS